MNGKNIQAALTRLRMSEDELTELWYELGHDFLRGLKKRIQRKADFDQQFSALRKHVQFNQLTVSELFSKVEISNHFWNWWLNCLSYACITVSRYSNGSPGGDRSYLINILTRVEYVPDYVLLKTLGINEHKKKFTIRGIGPATESERRNVQQAV